MTAATTDERLENDRVAALEACAIIDTPPEEAFDFIARLAAEVCGTEMAGITFIDGERQFFKSAVGLAAPSVPLNESFCQHTVASGSPMIVEDAMADERFRTSPLVTGGPRIRFYAGAPLRSGAGNVLGALCVMDVKPRRLTPHQLELLEGLAAQVTTLVEQRSGEGELEVFRRRVAYDARLAHVAAWEWDPVADRATWTPELRALLGVDAGYEPNLESLMALVHEEDRAHIVDTISSALASGGDFGYRARIVRPDGEVRTVDTQGETELDRGGEPACIRGATVDVTDLVEAERRSSEQAEGLHAAFETALDAILVADDDRRYVSVNRAACTLLGYTREELLGMGVEDLVVETTPADTDADWGEFVEAGQQRGEVKLRKADGSEVLLEYSANADFVPGRHLSVLRDVTKKREAEREALRSLQMLEDTQALAQIGSWEWDLESGLQVASDEFMRIIGHGSRLREQSYEQLVAHVHPDDRKLFLEVIEQALSSAEPFRLVFRVYNEAGELLTIESHGRTELNAEGEPERMLGTAQDISARERAEHELRLQANVLEQVPAGVIAAGTDRRITHWSRGAVELFGIAAEDAAGRLIDELDLFPPESREAREAMAALLGDGGTWEGEIVLQDKAGRSFPTLLTNSPILDRAGEVAGFVGVAVDLTERQSIEAEVGVQGHLLDQVEASVVAMDGERRITHWNHGAERLYGWSRAEAVGRAADELNLIAELREPVASRALAGGAWEGEVEVRRKDGTTFTAYTSNSVLHGADGSPSGYVGVSIDISDRKRAEQEALAGRLGTIKRLALAVEKRDTDTGRHIERIGEFSAMIAERLGVSPERVGLIRVSSTMHDVGKIGVPDSILLKPGKLTDAERSVMQTHTSIGHDILSGADADLDLAASIALTHHERVDGTGYPRGLSGDAIPLEGRIVAVADVFDALTSDRVYRKAFSVEKSIEMMVEGRGSHFDPAILDVLVDDLDSFVSVSQSSDSD